MGYCVAEAVKAFEATVYCIPDRAIEQKDASG